MNKKNIRLTAMALLFALQLQAQETKQLDEVVVSDSRFALPKEKSGKVIVKLTAKDLQQKQGQSLASILSTVAGVEINGNQSRNGKDLNYYIRGGRNHQTLILIDGMPVADASGVTTSYDLRLISVEQIESIEIMKGASSTLYGSGAATGVINISLKKARKDGVSGNFYSTIGTQTTANETNYDGQDFNQGLLVNGRNEKANFFIALNSNETTGISEAKSADNSKFEKDPFSKLNSTIKFGLTPNKQLKLDFFANYYRLKGKFDSGSFADDLDNYAISEQFNAGFSPKLKYAKGELVLNLNGDLITREIFSYNSLFLAKSRTTNADLIHKTNISDNLFLVTGAQFQFFDMENQSDYDNISNKLSKFSIASVYATAVYNADFGLNLNLGSRYTKHSKYGNNFVFNANPSFSFHDNFKVLGSYSTAFIAPSLYQLYSPYGNVDLKPEQDATAELGFEVKLWDKKLHFNALAFYRNEKSIIGYNLATDKYFNMEGHNNARGIETMLAFSPNKKIKVNANYTFTQLENQSQILNPKHKANLGFDYQANDRLAFNLAGQFVSDRRYDYTDYPAPTYDPVLMQEILKDYTLFNANTRYVLIKNQLNFMAAIDNIANKDFVEIRGFSTRGRNFKIGLTLLF